MINPRIKSIFSHIPFQELCIDAIDKNTTHDIDVIGNIVIHKYFKEKIVEISGTHSVVIFSEDLNRVVDFLNENPNVMKSSEPKWVSKFGYKVVYADEIEKYSPSSGYLYNLMKNNKMTNFIIMRTNQRPLCVSNYDTAVELLDKRMNLYY